jgi:hypothetical protein
MDYQQAAKETVPAKSLDTRGILGGKIATRLKLKSDCSKDVVAS